MPLPSSFWKLVMTARSNLWASFFCGGGPAGGPAGRRGVGVTLFCGRGPAGGPRGWRLPDAAINRSRTRFEEVVLAAGGACLSEDTCSGVSPVGGSNVIGFLRRRLLPFLMGGLVKRDSVSGNPLSLVAAASTLASAAATSSALIFMSSDCGGTPVPPNLTLPPASSCALNLATAPFFIASAAGINSAAVVRNLESTILYFF